MWDRNLLSSLQVRSETGLAGIPEILFIVGLLKGYRSFSAPSLSKQNLSKVICLILCPNWIIFSENGLFIPSPLHSLIMVDDLWAPTSPWQQFSYLSSYGLCAHLCLGCCGKLSLAWQPCFLFYGPIGIVTLWNKILTKKTNLIRYIYSYMHFLTHLSVDECKQCGSYFLSLRFHLSSSLYFKVTWKFACVANICTSYKIQIWMFYELKYIFKNPCINIVVYKINSCTLWLIFLLKIFLYILGFN